MTNFVSFSTDNNIIGTRLIWSTQVHGQKAPSLCSTLFFFLPTFNPVSHKQICTENEAVWHFFLLHTFDTRLALLSGAINVSLSCLRGGWSQVRIADCKNWMFNHTISDKLVSASFLLLCRNTS